MKTVSQIISILFHPLLMTCYGCILLFFGIKNSVFDILTPIELKWRIILIVFLFSALLPALNILLLYRYKGVSDITVSEQKERNYPFLITLIFYFGLYYMLLDTSLWYSIKLYILGAGCSILIAGLINLRFKISTHMVGIGGLFGLMISISRILHINAIAILIAIIVVAGLIGVSRLFLKEHKQLQIYSGFALGIAVQLCLFLIFKKSILV
ncbi:MAG: hypothetical protein JSU07_01530 [Bacteroidetes bacterium]|nr:hypothetical protein [Bacteroidota bacterium]